MEVAANTTPYRARQTRKRAAKEQTIFRAENKKAYTKISNKLANDSRLSMEALGLMTYVLNKPDDWVIRPGDLRKRGLGSHRRRRVLKELAEAGYIVRDEIQTRTEKGRWGERLWRVRENPEIELAPRVDFPSADEPPAETPPAENRQLINDESNLEMIHHDERDVFLMQHLQMFPGFESAIAELRGQLDRLGAETFEAVVKRCIKRTPKNIQYFTTALAAEQPHTPLPPSPQSAPDATADVTGLPEFAPADFEPNMPLFRRLAAWDAERALAAAEIAAGREYIYQPRDTYAPPVPTFIDPTPEDGSWSMAYMQLELQLDRKNFDTWVRGAKLLRVEGRRWVVGVRSSYARDMLQHRLYRNIWRVLADVVGDQSIELLFEIMQPVRLMT